MQTLVGFIATECLQETRVLKITVMEYCNILHKLKYHLMLKQCMTCAEQEKIVNESLSHKIKFTADYYELDEEEREES